MIFRTALMLNIVILAFIATVHDDVRANDGLAAQRLKQGHAVARAYCSPCHAIGRNDPSPVRANDNTAFRDLHFRYPIAMLSDALKTGRIEGHDEMPAFDLSVTAIANLLAYIDSLSPAQAPKYTGTSPSKQTPKK